jgi:hypothetical protein
LAESPQGRELRAAYFGESAWDKRSEQLWRAVEISISQVRAAIDGVRGLPARAARRGVLERIGLDLRRDTFLYCCNRLADDYTSVLKSSLRPKVTERAREQVPV